uniref:Uncharacterized protein n=1 Tax=Rhizophora mucronata TaxID=61149 RepID=A0A2P2LAH4_RHIMU
MRVINQKASFIVPVPYSTPPSLIKRWICRQERLNLNGFSSPTRIEQYKQKQRYKNLRQ